MNNWMKVFRSAAFVTIGGLALVTSAYGQEDRFEQVPSRCIIRADEVLVNEQPFTSAGIMNLEPGESFPADEDANVPAWMQIFNEGFRAESDDPNLGVITWELDNSRPVESSFIRSNQANALFPATVQLSFNVRATISTLGEDRVFLSRTPISISNNSPFLTDEEKEQSVVMSWPPGEIWLASVDAEEGVIEVEFFDPESGETAFIVNRLRSRVRD